MKIPSFSKICFKSIKTFKCNYVKLRLISIKVYLYFQLYFQKRLLLANVDKLHADFLKKHPNFSISLSAFRALKPAQCIQVGSKGTHNVCVCKIHGNLQLKQRGLKEEFARKKFNFQSAYRDYFKDMVCTNSTSDCFLRKCKNCPGTEESLKNLEENLKSCKIKSISFQQWLTTDR